ncbi:hypothetical protein B6V72_18555 [Thioclava sp. F34-6]|uniref:rhamnan synthesis F family protein n=1 Tax=Thioclava sp. F34-6 TaxID=1973003 RepID=UPI000B5483BC|nr:rhamnan synthesis F family protein [Thioclava sp. F34-6]OWY08446.1 hypothetical protein B6V72_18555 [Thioclava sp. F34-6]
MTPTPFWKIKRELLRLLHKPRNVLDLSLASFRQRQTDRSGTKVHTGEALLHRDGAVLLLYPAQGVPAYYIEMLAYLNNRGISPVVVSQLPLLNTDRMRLLAEAYLVIERPNYGYDFGGYRAGVLEILDQGLTFENLFILNDSIWFPLFACCDLIETARDDHSDLYGIYMNERPKTPQRSHLQSYFYRFGPKLTRSADFREFWRRLQTYNNKDLTIRRIEMRLTHWFASHGYSIGYRYCFEDVKEAMARLSVAERYALADYQILIGEKYSKQIKSRVAARAYDDDAIFLKDMEQGILGRYFMILHPALLLERMRCPVLKRDKRHPYQVQRAVLLSETFAADLPTELTRELEAATDMSLIAGHQDRIIMSSAKVEQLGAKHE